MKFCLSGRQSREYLKKANEVMLEYRDRDFIYDLVKINPDVIVTLAIPSDIEDKDIVWNLLSQYKVVCKEKFRIASYNINHLKIAKEKGFNFFSLSAARFGYELQALIDFGVCAVRISGQLIHQMEYLNRIENIELRVVVNSSNSFLNYSPLIGSWIRPEDLLYYERIDICEFQSSSVREEQALYRIYAEKKKWPGELHQIVKDIEDKEIINRLIPPEFGEKRSNCRQSCMNGGGCHLCLRIVNMAKTNFLRQIIFEEDGENNE